MKAYAIGTKFTVTLTDIDSTGMGTTYTLNDAIIVNQKQMDVLEMVAESVEKPTDKLLERKPTNYTFEELDARIAALTKTLTRLLTLRYDSQAAVNDAVDMADAELERG